jgi:hypothetical protein
MEIAVTGAIFSLLQGCPGPACAPLPPSDRDGPGIERPTHARTFLDHPTSRARRLELVARKENDGEENFPRRVRSAATSSGRQQRRSGRPWSVACSRAIFKLSFFRADCSVGV